MPTIDDLNEYCPEHDRTSCSDESPVNAGIDYEHGSLWCRRCEGLWQIRINAMLATKDSQIETLAKVLKDAVQFSGYDRLGDATPWVAEAKDILKQWKLSKSNPAQSS